MILTISITSKKKSVFNKVKKASITFQQFKNLVYNCANEYYNNTKDLSPFLSVNFLEKFVKGKVNLPYENKQIIQWKTELINLWKNEIGSDTVKSIVRNIVREYKSIVGKWSKGKYAGLPEPKEIETLYSFTIDTNPNMIVDKRKAKKNASNHIIVRLGKKFGAVKIPIPKSINVRHIKINWNISGEVIFLISYDVPVTRNNLNRNYFIAIDLGINNLISAISNKENLPSFLINGKPLKALNQWVNKLSAELQKNKKDIEHKKLWRYRTKRINQLFGVISNFIIQLCLKENIGTLVLSKSLTKEYQSKSNKGKVFNQNFRNIPLGKLIQILEYKCKLAGIKVVKESELYTSKVSSVSGNIEILSGKDLDDITENDKNNLQYNGKRIKRGLFKDHKINKVFNADLNGALNIAIKALGKKIRDEFLKIPNWLDKLCRPVKVNIFPHEKYPASLLMEIAGSSFYYLNGSSEGHPL